MERFDPTMMQAPAPDGVDMASMLMAVSEAMQEQTALVKEPHYPPWYHKEDYQKPTPGAVIVKARQLEAEFAPLRKRISDDLKTGSMGTYGSFRDHDKAEEDPWIDSGIAGEVELFASQLADAELSYDAPARFRSHEDESAKKIDFLIANREQAKRYHAAAGGGALAMEEARSLLLTGRIACFRGVNLDADDDELPLISHLLDPATCYPIFESHRGLRAMVRVYWATVGETVGAYENADHHLRATYLEGEATPSGPKKRREEERTEVIEYWDRRWRLVFMDSQVILGPVEHNYGFVPFIYKLGPLGLPSFMRDPGQATSDQYTIGASYQSRDVSMPHKGISLVGLLRRPHELYEAVMTRMLTAFQKEVKPAYIAELDEMTYPDGAPDVSDASGAVNQVKAGRQTIKRFTEPVASSAASPMLNGAVENMARLTQPATAHGANNQSNVSGFATQGLNESGRIKLVGWQQTLEEYHAECGEMDLRLLRDWGHELAQGNGAYGEFVIPRFDAPLHEDQSFTLTSEELEETGIRVRASLSTISLSQLGGVANAMSILKNMGAIDDIRIMRLIGDPNPYKTQARIRANTIINDPDLIEAQALQGLDQEGFGWIAQYMMWKKMQGGSNGPPQLGAGPPQGPRAIGNSLPALGQPPGPGSGPPPVAPDPFGGI